MTRPARTRSGWLSAIVLGSLLALAACSGPARDADPGETPGSAEALFVDVTASSGVAFRYRNGEEAGHYAILESLGGGVALLDYDGDGLLDLFLTGGGSFAGPDNKQIVGLPCKLYKNLGGFRFKDVTREVGLDRLAGGRPWFYSHGAAVADYNRDGWPDLLVTGYGAVALFRNESDGKGGRRFRDVTRQAGLASGGWPTSAGWADLDGDGYPDLYVCHYLNWDLRTNHPSCPGYADEVRRDICPPRRFDALPHRLYRNNQDGTFTDVSAAAGLRRDGKGLGVLLVDVDGDGRPDVYVANDTDDNFLYLNHGRPGKLRFEEVGFARGVARDGQGVPNGSMGVDAADYDGSGRPSLWVTNYENELHALYRNYGRAHFLFATQTAGIAAIGRTYVGFGTAFLDLDNDGWEDLVIANGHVIRHAANLRQKPILLGNRGDGHFDDISARGGSYFRATHLGRGLAAGDLDNDGRIDLVISHLNEPAALLRNVAGSGNHWLGVELVGRGHRDVAGARVVLEAGGRRQTRFARGGGSYLSSADRRCLFGLGSARRVDRLTVSWPSGRVQSITTGLGIDRYHRVVEE
jgi:hypothetical protein